MMREEDVAVLGLNSCFSAFQSGIWLINFMSHNVNVRISSLKKNPAENYMAPDPANFLISSLKKNPAENNMAPDPSFGVTAT
jgi:hypothetical protein